MATTNFIDKETIIEAPWLNDVDALVYEACGGGATAEAVRAALDVPQETAEVVPQVRVNGAWQALSGAVGPLHAATHHESGSDELDHDALLNGLGDKHVDHSGVTVTGSGALQGGGDLTASRVITFTYVLGQDLSANGFKVTNLLDPSTNQDAATKLYVDNRVIEAGGTPWQSGVPLNSIHYSNGFVAVGTDTPIYNMDVRGTMGVSELATFWQTTVTDHAQLAAMTCPGAAWFSGSIAGGATASFSTLAASGDTTLKDVDLDDLEVVGGGAIHCSADANALTIASANTPVQANGSYIEMYGNTHGVSPGVLALFSGLSGGVAINHNVPTAALDVNGTFKALDTTIVGDLTLTA